MPKQLVFFFLLMITGISLCAQNVLDCIPVVMTVNDQTNQVVVSANSGSAIIAWQDARTGNDDIYAQRVNDSGQMQWINHVTGKLVITNPSEQVNLSMVSDGLGGAFIAWQDNRNVNWDIYATRIDANGDIYPGWGVSGLAICTDTSDQSKPKLVSVGSDGAFVTWSDNRGGDYDIYTMRMHLDGTLTGNVDGTRMQLLPESSNQVNPDICIDGGGGAIIAYEQYTGAGDYDIYAQRIDNGCLNMWLAGGVPACIANNNQVNPKLTNDAVGSAIIVWEDNVNFTWDIYAQRVFAGAIQWTANGVAIMAIALDQINPVIVSAGLYTAIIVWEHYLSATDSNIYAQKIWGGAGGTSGTLQWLGTGVPVSTLQNSYQRHPQAVSDGADGAIIVYDSGENIGANGYDVYGQHLDSNGNPSVVDGYPICTWDTDQTYPFLAYSGTATNNAIYAWLDKRNEPATGIHDIYTLGVEDAPLPVELSSFTATQTAQNYVQLIWVSQSENQLMGYRVYRNTTEDQQTSLMLDQPMIPATNTSTAQVYVAFDNDVTFSTNYYYWLESVDYNSSTYYGPVSIYVQDEIYVPPVLPETTTLRSAFPNPFETNSYTNIGFSLKSGESGTISIFNVHGQMVKSFSVSEGSHTISWNGKDSNGKACASGIYLYQLKTPSLSQSNKMMILK